MNQVDGVPKYVRIQETLRSRISTGQWLPGQEIPSEIQLASDFGVSVPTMGRALVELSRAGLLVRTRGRGTQVALTASPAQAIQVEAAYAEVLGGILRTLAQARPFVDREPAAVSAQADVLRRIFPALQAEHQALVDLGPLVAGDPGFDLSAYEPHAVAAARRDGVLYGLPVLFSPYVAVLNLDLWAAAGVPAPDARSGWDWAEFEATLRRLARAPELRSRGAQALTLSANIGRVLSFVFQAGGRLIERQAEGVRVDAGLPESRAGLSFFRKLLMDDELTLRPGVDLFHAADCERNFTEGRAAVAVFSAPVLRRVRNVACAWTCVELPRGRERASALAGDAWCLSSRCARREWGWEVLKALAGPAALSALASAGWGVPARKDLAARAAAEAPERERALYTALPFARAEYTFGSPVERSLVMGALEDYFLGRLDLDGFCRHLESVLRAYYRHVLAAPRRWTDG